MKFEKFIDEYKEIKAPDALKDRIYASAASKPRRIRVMPRILVAAAVFVLVVSAAVLWEVGPFRSGTSGTGAYIAYSGVPVDDPVAVSVRSAADFSMIGPSSGGILLEVHVTGETTVSVSDGAVFLAGQNNAPTFTGDPVVISGEIDPGTAPTYAEDQIVISGEEDLYTLYWRADFQNAGGDTPFVLTLQDAHGSVTYTLTSTDGQITLRKTGKN